MNTAVLISGKGSNLEALLAYERTNKTTYRISLVISNKQDVFGLQIAAKYNIPYQVVPHTQYKTREAFEQAMQVFLEEYNIQLLALAGFMRLLTSSFLDTWEGHILNIHPSLLPNFPGLNTHKRVLQAGKKESGCTVFFVDNGLDTGIIIAQTKVPVLPNDTEETLAKRVLKKEHTLFPFCLEKVATKQITLQDLQNNKK